MYDRPVPRTGTPTVDEIDARERLARVLRAAAADDGVAGPMREALRGAVAGWVRAARRRGIPSEHLVLALRTELADLAGLRRIPHTEYARVIEPAIRCCIEEYFRPSPAYTRTTFS